MDNQQKDEFISVIASALAELLSDAIEEARSPDSASASGSQPEIAAAPSQGFIPDGGIVMDPPAGLGLEGVDQEEAQIDKGGLQLVGGEVPLGAPSTDLGFLGPGASIDANIIDDDGMPPAPAPPAQIDASGITTGRDPEGGLGQIDAVNEEGRFKVEPELITNAQLAGDLGDRMVDMNKQIQRLMLKMIDSLEDNRKRIIELESRLERDRGYYY